MDLISTKHLAKQVRRDIIDMTFKVGASGTHIGGSLSIVEILSVLYKDIMTFDCDNMESDLRDRFILSKGHGAMTMFAVMNRLGILSDEEIQTFKTNGADFATHPSMNPEKGIDFSTGSLGHGLSLGVGSALALKRKNNPSRVFVLMGDGECDEGSIWEAAMSAVHFKLDNLVLIIDRNKLQLDGEINDIMTLGNLDEKWKSFGWKVFNCNGHCVSDFYETVKTALCNSKGPQVIIADTIKGKGVSFIENKYNWHIGVLTKELYDQAVLELEGAIC